MLDAFHKEVWNPKSVEEVTCSIFFIAVVDFEFEEVFNVGVPRFKLDGERTFAFTTSLVTITSSIIENAKHRDDAVALSSGSSDIRATGSYIVDMKTNTASPFGDESAIFESVINSGDGVIFHRKKEAG